MFADLHIHMLLSGSDWKAAVAGHQPSPDDALWPPIRRRASPISGTAATGSACAYGPESWPRSTASPTAPRRSPSTRKATTAASSAADGRI